MILRWAFSARVAVAEVRSGVDADWWSLMDCGKRIRGKKKALATKTLDRACHERLQSLLQLLTVPLSRTVSKLSFQTPTTRKK